MGTPRHVRVVFEKVNLILYNNEVLMHGNEVTMSDHKVGWEPSTVRVPEHLA